MPPATFIDKVAGTGNASTNQTFVPPGGTRPGDVEIVVVASEEFNVGLAQANFQEIEGWEELALVPIGVGSILVARRIAREDDPASFRIILTGGALLVGSSMLIYRGLDPGAAVVGASGTAIVTSMNFVCPSRALARYSDLYIGIVSVTSAAVAVTHPAGTNERHDFSPKAGKQLEIFDLLVEAPGATGTKTATTAANQSGMAASVALAANGLLGGKSLSSVSPVSGMLGLPTRGC